MITTNQRSYTENHRIETISLHNKFNIRIRKHYINKKLKSTDVLHKFIHENCCVSYITNKTVFDSFVKKNHFSDIRYSKICGLTEDIPLDDKIDPTRFVYFYVNGHVIFDYQGNPILYLHKFDYCGSPFHNGKLKLKEAIKILKQHKNVKYVSEIEDVPYYNSDDNHSKYINVHILPSKDMYKQFYKKSEPMKTSWSCRMKDMVHDGYCPDKKNNYLGLFPDAVKEQHD